MFKYSSHLKPFSRRLRRDSTEAERKLWSYLRNNQINSLRFTRQKPLGKFIVDFYCHKLKLIIELDGSQHLSKGGRKKDKTRDVYYRRLGLRVLRIPSNEVLRNPVGTIRKVEDFTDDPN